MEKISIRLERQQNDVGEEISALLAVVRPILQGLLLGIKTNIAGGPEDPNRISLHMLSRLYRPGDGDVGICFEYAVHDAVNRRDESVMERLSDSMQKFCKMKGQDTQSILFGAEKNGSLKLIDTARSLLTHDSRLLTGAQAQPVKLRRYINLLAAAFRRPSTRRYLPASISGAWKADLFIGMRDTDRYVATSVKINPSMLEAQLAFGWGLYQQVKESRIKSDLMTTKIWSYARFHMMLHLWSFFILHGS